MLNGLASQIDTLQGGSYASYYYGDFYDSDREAYDDLNTISSIREFENFKNHLHNLVQNPNVYAEEIPTGKDAGKYTVWYNVTGDNNYNTVSGYVNVTIAKDNVQITKDPALVGTELDYTATAQDLITAGEVAADPGSETGEPQGTMKYAATDKVIGKLHNGAGDLESIAVGDAYTTSDNDGYNFPSKYQTIVLDGETYTNATYNGRINLYYSNNLGSYSVKFYNHDLKDDCDAVVITGINDETGTITFESIKASEYTSQLFASLEFKEEIPQATKVGTYYVYYKVDATDNYNDVAPTKLGQVKIEYATSTLTLAKTLGAVKVADEDGKDVDPVTPSEEGSAPHYSITATKAYKIYTENTVSQDVVNKYKLGTGWDTVEGDKFEYVYTLTVPVTPEEGGYVLSHDYNWTGKQYTDEPDVLYIADGAVTEVTRQKAATLKGQSIYYYGDTPSDKDVEIGKGFESIVKVDSVSFIDSTGAVVTDLSKLEYGTYTLRAKILIDSNANGTFNEDKIDSFVYISKEVKYEARPMVKNDYFLVIDIDGEYGNEEYKLEVDEKNQRVTVPNTYWQNTQTGEISLTEPKKEDTSSGGDPVEGESEPNDQESNWVEKTLYTYDQQDHIPEVVVKNGGNNNIAVTLTTEEAKGDYNSSRLNTEGAYKNAGDYNYTLTAETGTTEAPANYSGAITVEWKIAKANISEFITVAPNNNGKLEADSTENDAIIYDGKDLDGDDFVVSTNDNYKDLSEGSLEKALVDELIAGTKKEEAAETTASETGTAGETIVDSGTTVVSNVFKTELVVTPAIGTVYSDNIKYDTAGTTFGYSEGTGYNRGDFNGKVIGGNIDIKPTKQVSGGNDGDAPVNVTSHVLYIGINNDDKTIQKLAEGIKTDDTRSTITYNNIHFSSDYTLTYNSESGALTIKSEGGNDYTFYAKEGYKLCIESIGGGFEENESGSLDGEGETELNEVIYIFIKAVPTSGLTDGVSNIKDASVEGEVKKANVTVKHNNFEDIEFKQTLDENGKVNAYVVDNSLKVNIAKREVTITPKNVEDNPFVYGTYVGTSEADKAKFYEDYITYDFEKAEKDSITGLVDADIKKENEKESSAIDFSEAFKLVEKTGDNNGFTFGDRWANEVDGGYKYVEVTGFDGAPNYDVVIDENAEFVVTPKAITAAMFTLYTDSGLTAAYETAYKYNGDKQQVYVKGVDTVESTVTFNASEFKAVTTGEGNEATTTYNPLTKEGVTVNPDVVENVQSNEHFIVIQNISSEEPTVPEITDNLVVSATNNIKEIVLTLKADDEITAENISDYLNLDGFPEDAIAELVTSESGTTVVITLAENTNEATIAAKEGKTISVSKVEVTYTDVNTLTNDADFNVIGTTEGILPDTFLVGFKGVGNYAGTILDKLNNDPAKSGKQWEIESVDLGTSFAIASTTVKNGTGAFPGYYYNGEAPEFTTDSSLRANENKILYFRLNGYNSDEFDEIENELNTAKSNLEQAKTEHNTTDIETYTAAVEKYEKLAAFINANPDFKPELTYYQLVEEKAAPSETAGTATDTDTDAEEVEKITVGEETYVKLDEAPVNVGKYLVKATFRAEGFTFNDLEKLETFDFFEIRTADYDLTNDFDGFTYEKDYGELEVDAKKPELSFDVTDIYKDSAESQMLKPAGTSQFTEKGLVPVRYFGVVGQADTTTDEEGNIHRIVPVIKGTVKVSFAGHLNGTYVNAGKYDYDTTGVEYGTVELIYDETGKIVEIGEFTKSDNYKVVWSSKYTVNKLKLTNEMFETVPVALVDGVADLSKAAKPSEEYAKLLRESDYLIVGAQTTANVGKVNVQFEATEKGNFTGVVKLQGEVVDTGTAIVKSRSADLSGQIKLNVYITLPESVTDSENEGYVVFTKNGLETKLTVSELTYRTVGEEKQYRIAVPYGAVEMHDDVNIKVFTQDDVLVPMSDSDENVFADGYTMSLADYLEIAKTKSTNANMVALAKATEDYGIATQKYFSKGDYTNLSFSDDFSALTKEQLQEALSEYEMTETDTLPEGISKVSMSLECLDTTTFRLKVQFKNGYDASNFTFTVDGEPVELNNNAFEILEIGSVDLDNAHVFTISDGETTYSTTRSALSWAYAASKVTTQKTVDLAKALYLFNAKANNYFTKS